MANGDLAASEAGFTPVKNTDDFRLGYDRINEGADLAVKRGIRSFASETAMKQTNGKFWGDKAIVAASRIMFLWNGSLWQPWESAWQDWNTTINGASLSSGSNTGEYKRGRYRWEAGMVHVQIQIGFGTGGSITGGIILSVPQKVAYKGYNTARSSRRIQGATTVVNPQNGRMHEGAVYVNGGNADDANILLGSLVVNDTFAYGTTVANGQPIGPAQYAEIWVDCVYESADYLLG